MGPRERTSRPGAFPGGTRVKTCLGLIAAVLLLAALPGVAATGDGGSHLMALLERMEASYGRVEDYSALFSRLERIENKLVPDEAVFLKFKKPFNLYMKWTVGPRKEALYVEGGYDGKVVAHCDGVGGGLTWHLDPKGSILMDGNRHPITDVGFAFILGVMRWNFSQAVKHGELQVLRMEDEAFLGRPCLAVEARFTPGEGRRYYASRIVVRVDKELLLPVGIACYDEKDALFEEYSYKDVKINVGFTSKDFSKRNAEYFF